MIPQRIPTKLEIMLVSTHSPLTQKGFQRKSILAFGVDETQSAISGEKPFGKRPSVLGGWSLPPAPPEFCSKRSKTFLQLMQ